MFIKILKYDFLYVLHSLKYFFLVLIGASILARLTSFSSGTNFLTIINVFFQATSYAMLIASFFVPFVLCMKRYWNTMLADEGYLTHCLPVKKSVLLLSKYLSVLVYYVITILIFILCRTILETNYLVNLIESVKRDFSILITSAQAVRYLCWLLIIILEVAVGGMVSISMCCSLGARHDNKKGLKTFLYLLLVYFILIFCISILIRIFATYHLNLDAFCWIIIGFFGAYIVGCYYVNYLMISRYLNLQ